MPDVKSPRPQEASPSGGSRRLRAVSNDDQPPAEPAKPKSISQAAREGTERELLVAIRDRIAETVERSDCPPRELASLTKRLQDIRKEIAGIDEISSRANPQQQTHADADDSFDTSVI